MRQWLSIGTHCCANSRPRSASTLMDADRPDVAAQRLIGGESRRSYMRLPLQWSVLLALGEPVLSKTILVGKTAVQITENYLAALRQLAKMGSQQLLWIDALCINQSDNLEKSHQVQMMGKIYAQVEQVLIWLGMEDDTSASATRFIRTVAALVDRHFPSSWEDLSFVNDLTRPRDPQQFKDDLDDILVASEWSHLSKLFQRPCFSRRWVIQEACLAQRALVLCDSSTNSWINFPSAVTLLHMYQHARHLPPSRETHLSTPGLLLPQLARTSAWQPIQAKRKHAMTHPFLRFAGFACQDSRDYVFVLLSLTICTATLPASLATQRTHFRSTKSLQRTVFRTAELLVSSTLPVAAHHPLMMSATLNCRPGYRIGSQILF